MSEKTPETPEVLEEDAPTLDRREALKKLGKYGAYTAPVAMALLAPRKAEAGTATSWVVR